jgi:hypothetical protein
MADGSGYAGSTAWNNAVRNRLAFERPDPKGSRRILRVAKTNYGSENEIELFQFGMTFVEAGSVEIASRETEERDAVKAVTLALLDQGVTIVRSNGSGQKPADVAKAVFDKHGFRLEPKRVLEHLNALERMGVLTYETSNKNKYGQRAGFRKAGGNSHD